MPRAMKLMRHGPSYGELDNVVLVVLGEERLDGPPLEFFEDIDRSRLGVPLGRRRGWQRLTAPAAMEVAGRST